MAEARDMLHWLKTRRSVRKFDSRPLSDEQLDMLVESLIWAPSGGNRQPWNFYIIRSPQIKKELAVAARGQTFIADAPVIIGVAAVPQRSAERYGDRGRNLYSLQDTAAAVQNCLLMAWAMGLGTCWIGAFSDDDVARVLNLSADERPVALIPVGYPLESPAPRPRMAREDIVRFMD